MAEALRYFDIVRLAREGTRRMHDEMLKLGLRTPQFADPDGRKVLVTLFNDVERRRSRSEAQNLSQQWMEVRDLLPSDLAIYRRRAISQWELLAGRGALAPQDLVNSAVNLLVRPQLNWSEKAKIIRLLSRTREVIAPADRTAMVDLFLGGTFDEDAQELLSELADMLGSFDDGVERTLQWLETPSDELQVSPVKLRAAFGVLWRRLHREPLPARDWVDRAIAVARKHKDMPVAVDLFVLITGHQP